MSFTRRRLDAAAARFGWRRACTTGAEVDALLAEQADTAYAQADDRVALAVAKYPTALCVQPGVLDVRGRLLQDLVYLDGVLAGARHHRLDRAVIGLLEVAVAQGRELSQALGYVAHATAELSSSPPREPRERGDSLTGR